MVASARSTANQNDKLVIQARIDDNDPLGEDYYKERRREAWQVIRGPRRRLSELWNEMAVGEYDIFTMCADDVRFRTRGWDDEVRAAFARWPDRIGMVYGDDGVHGPRLATLSFVSKQWIDAVGFYLPDTMTGDFVDNWLHGLAASIDRVTYLPQVYIEHLHPVVGKAQMDDTYAYRLTGEGPRMAQDAWNDVLRSGMPGEAIRKLKGAMSAPSQPEE
jgi:hypothetical protein